MISLIKHKRRVKRVKRLFPFSIVLLAIGIWIYNEFYPDAPSSKVYILISSLLFFLWFISTIYFIYFIKAFIVIGKLFFKNEYIILNNEKIENVDIESFRVIYRSYYGQATGSTFYVKQGDNNEIILKQKNGKEIQYYFILNSRREYDNLKKIVSIYKKKRVNIKLIEKKY